MLNKPWLALPALLALACEPPSPASLDDGATTTTAGPTSSSSSSSSSSTDTGGPEPTGPEPTSSSSNTTDFVPDADVSQIRDCDPFLQDCPDGEKCVPYGSNGGNWDANKCVPVLGDQSAGQPCHYDGVAEGTDDCDELSACWDVMDLDGEAIGTCHLFCTGTSDDPMCPEGSQCLISGDSVIVLCIPTCNPLIQDCDEGLACYWDYGSSFNCVPPSDQIPLGQPCGFINDCDEGLICLSAEVMPDCLGRACCGSFCDLELGDDPCAELPGTACVPFFEEGTAVPGYENVGVCILP